MSPLSNIPSTDPLTLLDGCKSPAVFFVFKIEPALSPVAVVLTLITKDLNKVFLTILTSIRRIFFFNNRCEVVSHWGFDSHFPNGY